MSEVPSARGFCRGCGAGPLRVPLTKKAVACPECGKDLSDGGLRAESELTARIKRGTPLRVGELARLLGYSRETVRTWVLKGTLETVQVVAGAERRIPVDEATRLGRELGLL